MATGKLSNFKKETLSFFYTVFTLLFLISIFTHDPDDPSFFNSGLSDSVNNYIGIVGAYISFLFFYLFGKVSFLIPIILIYIILKNYMSNIIYTTASKVIRTLLMIILLLSLCGLLSQYDISLRDDINNLSGGIIGLYLSEILMSFFGMTGSILIMSFIFLFSSIKFFDLSLQIIALRISNLFKYSYLKLRFHFMQAIDKYKLMKEKIKERKNLASNGFVDLTLIVASSGKLQAKPILNIKGLPIFEKEEFLNDLEHEIIKLTKTFSLKNAKQQDNLIDSLKKTCRKYAKEKTGKKPITNINVVRI